MASHSETVFSSLNLNPQLFINEVFNTIDGLMNEAFESYELEAAKLLNDASADKFEKLKEGVSTVYHMVQELLDKHLGGWEMYCLQHIFVVPDGFSWPESENVTNSVLYHHDELDVRLESLRTQLTAVARASKDLHVELDALQAHSTFNRKYTNSIEEALKPYKQVFIHDIFQELVKGASQLRTKMKMVERGWEEETREDFAEKIYSLSRFQLQTDRSEFREFANAHAAS